MLSFSRICVLIQTGSVKLCQSVCISWEMRRNPVKNNTDFMFVQIVYQICKVLRRSITGSRCKVSGYLIAPGTIKRILGDSHQLNVSISHLFYIFGQFHCQFTVCIESGVFIITRMTFPRTRMYLINGHRLTVYLIILVLSTRLHPFLIRPFQFADICHLGCCSRTHLRIVCIRICLIQFASILSFNEVFIHVTDLHIADKQLINAIWLQSFHLM